MPYTRPLSLQRFIGIALLTLTVTWLSRFTSIAGDISLIWPVTGISVAAALLWGPIATLAVGCGVIGWAALSNFSPQAWPLLFAEASVPGLMARYWPASWSLADNRALGNLFNLYLRGLLPGASSAALFGSLAVLRLEQFDNLADLFGLEASESIENNLANAFASQLIDALRDLGASVSLDDFGTGLATFDYLKQFRFDYLKIDGSFVRELASSTTDQAIVRAMVSVAKTLDLQTIAEFVESEDILNRLQYLKVDFAQGFHLGRPAPLQEWPGWQPAQSSPGKGI